MKLAIDNGTTKRNLEGSFAICGSVEDLTRLRGAIDDGLRRAAAGGAIYGWLVEVHPRIVGKPNTEPRAWDE